MDLTKCDFCKKEFDVHRYSYQKVDLPRFTCLRGLQSDNVWRGEIAGSYNSEKYDVCPKCFQKIIKLLKNLEKND